MTITWRTFWLVVAILLAVVYTLMAFDWIGDPDDRSKVFGLVLIAWLLSELPARLPRRNPQ